MGKSRRRSTRKGTSGKIRQFFVDHFNYFTIHALYFVFLSLVGGGVLYACEQVKEQPPAFIDCLFMAVSGLCVTGLISVDFARYEDSSQAVVFILVFLGGQVFMSVVPVYVRQTYFAQAIEDQCGTSDETTKAQARAMPEYLALKLVIRISLCIFCSAILIGTLVLGFYFQFVPSRRAILEPDNVNPWWFALFTSMCSFNNAGLLQIKDNLIPLNDDYLTLGVLIILILIGNTAYPILFRFVVHLLHKRKPDDPAITFLLDHPRRVYTMMFPALHTRILMVFLVCFTLAEFICFLSLDFNKKYFLEYPPLTRALIGIFQSFSTRSAGFNTIDMSQVAPAMSFLICVLMYVSSVPVIAGLRNASAQSKDGAATDDKELAVDSVRASVGGQVVGVLQKNGITLLVCLFILCITEAPHLRLVLAAGDDSTDPFVGIFALIYEASSAYGNVGLTLGLPGSPIALSGSFTVIGKLVIIFLMLAGRHRGLPSSVERAVSLENLLAKNKAPRNSIDVERSEGVLESTVAQPYKYRRRITESLDRMLAGTWGTETAQQDAPRLRVNANTFTDPEAVRLAPSTTRLGSGNPGLKPSPRIEPLVVHTTPSTLALERAATGLKLPAPETPSSHSSSTRNLLVEEPPSRSVPIHGHHLANRLSHFELAQTDSKIEGVSQNSSRQP